VTEMGDDAQDRGSMSLNKKSFRRSTNTIYFTEPNTTS